MKKITFEDKTPIQTDETIARKNKITAEDFNEIKSVVNANAECIESNYSDISNIKEEQENQNANIEENKSKIIELQTKNAELEKENIELKEESNKLKEDLNAFPAIKESGEYITLDTADSRFKEFKVTGNSKQEVEPSIEAPSEIQNVGGNIEINIYNKNLANRNWAQRFVNVVNNETLAKLVTEDNRNCLNYNAAAGYKNNEAYFFKGIFKKNTPYTIQFYMKPTTATMNVTIRYDDGTVDYRSNLTPNIWQKIVIKTVQNKTLESITPRYQSGNSYIDLDTVQIEEGDTETEYIEPKQQTIIFPLAENQKLRLGDYLAGDGIHHRRKQIVLNGAENWLTAPVATNTIAFGLILNDKTDGVGFCNSFKMRASGVSSVDEEFCQTENSGKIIYIKINKERLSSVDVKGFKAWIKSLYDAETPVVVEYELAEEEIEPYTTEQAEVYKQIQDVRSYEGQTSIFSTNETSPIFEVTARKNLSTILNNLQAQILAVGGE